jgi:hypothetical protein
MKIWYDTEFLEDGRTILPISIGMVREDGETLYAVNDQLLRPPVGLSVPPDYPYARVAKHEWLMANVVPHLPLYAHEGARKRHGPVGSTIGGEGFFHLDPEHSAVLPLRLIRAQVRQFVLEVQEPELWSWFASYDHLVLCQLFGKMIDLPEGFPMHTNDVMTLATLAGGRQASEPTQKDHVHDALADAWHHKALWKFYTERLAEQASVREKEMHKAQFLGNWTAEERPTIPVFEVP